MTVTHSSILEAIYASSALATLSPEHRTTLLHPDHAPALRALIPDAAGIIVSRCRDANLALQFKEDSFEVTSGLIGDSETFEAALRPAMVAVILYIIRLAAGDKPDFPHAELDSLSALASASPNSRAAIRPYY